MSRSKETRLGVAIDATTYNSKGEEKTKHLKYLISLLGAIVLSACGSAASQENAPRQRSANDAA
jgi:hypothetical protein